MDCLKSTYGSGEYVCIGTPPTTSVVDDELEIMVSFSSAGDNKVEEERERESTIEFDLPGEEIKNRCEA